MEKHGSEQVEITEINKKIEEKYFAPPRAESNFDSMGPTKLIDGKVFFVYKAQHSPRDHGYSHDILFIFDKEINQLFRFDGEVYDKYENHYMDDPKKTYKRPEFEFKEIIGMKGGAVEILNGKGEIITIEVPEGVLNKEK